MIEYRVRPVNRFVVTRFYDVGEISGRSSNLCGEFDNLEWAEKVGSALAMSEEGAVFTTLIDKREPVGTFHAMTSEQSEALLAFIHSDAYPKDDPDAGTD